MDKPIKFRRLGRRSGSITTCTEKFRSKGLREGEMHAIINNGRSSEEYKLA